MLATNLFIEHSARALNVPKIIETPNARIGVPIGHSAHFKIAPGRYEAPNAHILGFHWTPRAVLMAYLTN